MLELDDLSKKPPATADVTDHDNDGVDDDNDDSSYAIPSLILTLVSLVFVFFPGFAFYLASSDAGHAATPLERFLLAQLGIYFFVMAASLLLRVFLIHYPTYSTLNHTQTSRHPLLIPLTLGSSISAFLSYNTTSAVGSLATFFFLSQLALSLWGFYSLLFGNEPADLHRSKTTGADKRTSSFIFGNKAAASIQKKEWRKRMKGED